MRAAICRALRAAPLRRLSATVHRQREFGDSPLRILPTPTLFSPCMLTGMGKPSVKSFTPGASESILTASPISGLFETRENCDTVTVSDRYSYGVGVYWDIAVKNFFEFKTYLVFFTRTAGGVDLADKRDKIGAYWEGEGFGFEHRVIEVVKCAGARSRNCLICTNVNFFQREDAVQRCKAYSRLYG